MIESTPIAVGALRREPADPAVADAIAKRIAEDGLDDIEVFWPDHQGHPSAATLADGVAAARADGGVTEILGDDAVHDYSELARLEWEAFVGAVSDWDRERYLRAV